MMVPGGAPSAFYQINPVSEGRSNRSVTTGE